MKRPIAPFRLPPEGAVQHAGWHLTGPEGDTLLPAEMEHWDYQTTLSLNAAVSVDRRTVLEACDLDPASELGVVVTAHSTHTRIEERVARLTIPKQDRYDLAVHLELPGQWLGGRLRLRSCLVALEPVPLSPVAPALPGSILWTVDHRTDLQGIGAQFPTDASDFKVTRPSAHRAAWDLQIDVTDPDALFMSSARLTLNSGIDAVKRLLDGSTDEVTQQLQRTLRWDVLRQMVMLGLMSDDVAHRAVDPEAVSVAGVLRNAIAQVWPREDPETIRGWLVNDPARVERDLQHHCGLVQ